MKVSVIMCSYNVEAFIERAIDSIMAQSYQDWELIISDDASTDTTLKLIEPYLKDSRIKLYAHTHNSGYVKNKNIAFGYATGLLLTQLDADDSCPKDRLQKQVDVFVKNPSAMICGSGFRQIDLHDNILPATFLAGEDRLIENFDKEYPFWFPGLMFRAELVKEFGLFSEYFSGIYGDDNYWTIRVNKKYPIYFIKDELYYYRVNPHSITNVQDNPRKMIVSEIVNELARQQKERGSDWLVEGKPELMCAFEQQALSNNTLMGSKYRDWAAKAIDKRDFPKAKSLLKLALANRPTDLMVYRTYVYYWKQKLKPAST